MIFVRAIGALMNAAINLYTINIDKKSEYFNRKSKKMIHAAYFVY